MPSVMAPGGSSSLPPMAGLLAPAMPNIMPGGGPGGPPPGAPPPFPQQGMFAPMQVSSACRGGPLGDTGRGCRGTTAFGGCGCNTH